MRTLTEILKLTNFEVCLHSLQNCENQQNDQIQLET